MTKEKGAKSFYLLGSDYIWPRTSNKIARKHIENHLKTKVVGEEYFPLGHTQFNSVINKIKLTKPDVIYAIIVGGSNVAFYKQLKAAGIDLSKQTLLTISVTEDEIDGIGGENIAGAFACMKYFQSLDNPNNKEFVTAFKKMWGDKTVIGDVTQAAYLGPWLWKATVEKAGSFDIDKVAAASPGGPGGTAGRLPRHAHGGRDTSANNDKDYDSRQTRSKIRSTTERNGRGTRTSRRRHT